MNYYAGCKIDMHRGEFVPPYAWCDVCTRISFNEDPPTSKQIIECREAILTRRELCTKELMDSRSEVLAALRAYMLIADVLIAIVESYAGSLVIPLLEQCIKPENHART